MPTTLDVVEQAMQGIPGLRITSTYRTPEHNRAIGGSPTSHHLNKDNPAVDVSGPETSMDKLADRLRDLPYDAELLWQTTGHFDHVHYAIRDTAGVSVPSFGDDRSPSYQPRAIDNLDQFLDSLTRLPTPLTVARDNDALPTPTRDRETIKVSEDSRDEETTTVRSTTTVPRMGPLPASGSRKPASARLRERPSVGRR